MIALICSCTGVVWGHYGGVSGGRYRRAFQVCVSGVQYHRGFQVLCVAPQADSPVMKKAVSLLSLTTPTSGRKRRRLRDTLAQLSRETEISPFPPRKRQSAEHSLSMGSLLDISNTPDTAKALGGEGAAGGGATGALGAGPLSLRSSLPDVLTLKWREHPAKNMFNM